MDVLKATKDDEGRCFLEGKASDTGVDQQDERLSDNALASLATQVQNALQQIPAYPRHKSDWTETLGYIVDARVEDNNLWVKIELEMANPVASRLWKMILTGRKFGLSVGGFLRSAFFEFSGEARKVIKVLDDFIFDHIVVTTKPVNPRTWLKQIGKSLDEYDISDDESSTEGMVEMEDMEEQAFQLVDSQESFEAVVTELGTDEEITSEEAVDTEEAAVEEAVFLDDEDESEQLESALRDFTGEAFPAEEIGDSFAVLEQGLLAAARSEATDEELLSIAKGFVDVIKSQDPGTVESVQVDRLNKAHVVQRLYEAATALNLALEHLDPSRDSQTVGVLKALGATLENKYAPEQPEMELQDDANEKIPPVIDGILGEGGGFNPQFAELIEQSLNKWLEDYGYRVVDIVPADEEAADHELAEFAPTLAQKSLPDDAFAHIETLDDGTKIRTLPYKRKNGKIDKRHLALAVATLNGSMGGVDLADDARQSAYDTLSKAYESTFKKAAPALRTVNKDKVQSVKPNEMAPEAPTTQPTSGVEAPVAATPTAPAEAAAPPIADQPDPAFEAPLDAQEAAAQFTQPEIAVAPPEGQTEKPAQLSDPNTTDFGAEMVTQMKHLSNIVQQMQEQMLAIQQQLSAVSKSFDDLPVVNKSFEFPGSPVDSEIVAKAVTEKLGIMVEAKLSTVTRENDKTSQVLNEKLDGINEAIARSQDTLERVKGEVVQVQKAQEELDQLKPVLKMLEHLPVRKAIVVDSRDPQQPQKAPELANNASEEERRIWARNRLKEIPFNLPNQ
jgi:hypothetical protein